MVDFVAVGLVCCGLELARVVDRQHVRASVDWIDLFQVVVDVGDMLAQLLLLG